jgi:PleD family two-component response regulator
LYFSYPLAYALLSLLYDKEGSCSWPAFTDAYGGQELFSGKLKWTSHETECEWRTIMENHIRILVTDDDPQVLLLTSSVLKRAGYEVLEARTGKECLEMAYEIGRAHV